MTEIVIAGAARTAVGSFGGAFAGVPAHELGATALRAALERAGVRPQEVGETVMGQVLTAGAGMNPARQAHLAAGMPQESAAWGVNQVCGSGLRAVALGAERIILGDAAVVCAGGQENMTRAPHAANLRAGQKMGEVTFIDTMLKDGLWDAFGDYHMGQTAENVAARHGITREEQDAFAAASQARAEAAREAGRFAEEIAAVSIPGRGGETLIETDEHIRPGTTTETLARLRPAFTPDGTVTAGNASGINDGAAAVVMMTGKEAARRRIAPLGRIASYATAGLDPAYMGEGPIHASRKALDKAGWSAGDLDLIEANEAFAAQAIAVTRQMGWDPERVNVNGGAIALGHPIGASGARVLVTLLHEMQRRDVRRGLATLCIGGGMGVALCIER
ncbi:acetyl-CoA C-acetyltransferase [Pseudoroseicyclus aestuarii]|uniref:Acetyl-CoA acetyltransferase n=1 Tax=Pseudoroseicyclus aestuarii TaxID=1795041 RepID=A0A318SRP3_9RHOB|nr:acetyl-CoA C-acetyltransferase [Pseudoroseicyclus aestuarii]PYE84272.1 acetyl-CoA acetyltransferase [Pseudoroseicyclus aestuarii]